MKKLLLFLMLLLVFACSAFADTTTGLVTHYPMNGDGTNIGIASNNTLIMNGSTVTEDRHGNADSALFFDGGDKAYADGDFAPTLLNALTLSAWVNPGSFKKQYIISKGSEPYFSYALYLNFYQEAVFVVSVDRTPYFVKFSDYPTNTWFHIAAKYDGNEIKIYLNGELKNTEEVSGNIDTDSSDIYIGSLSVSYVDVFDGAIDDVRIYERALSNADISELALEPDDNGSVNTDQNPDNNNSTENLCSADTPELCDTEVDCLAFGGLWQDNACSKPIAVNPPFECSSDNLAYCLNKLECKDAGGSWYFGVCMPESGVFVCLPHNFTYCTTMAECQNVGGVWDGSSCSQDTTPEQDPEEIPSYFGNILNLKTGVVNSSGGLGLNISNLTFAGDKYDVSILLGLDGTWSVSDGQDSSDKGSGINLATAMIEAVEENSFFIRGLNFEDGIYNFMVELEMDGSFTIPELEFASPMDSRVIPGTSGSLYEYGFAADGTRKNVEQIATIDQYLFAALRSNTSDQLVEVFNISNPLSPTLVQTLNFGNIQTNQQAVYDFPKLFTFANTLIIRSGDSIKSYNIGENNLLEQVSQFSDDNFSISSAGVEIGANLLSVNNAQTHMFINFADPLNPFVHTDSEFTSGIASMNADVVGTYQGNASAMDIDGSEVKFTTYKRHIREHLDSFWSDKIRLIFKPDILDKSLRSVVIDVAESVDTKASLNLAMDGYRQELGFDEEYTVDKMISKKFTDNDQVIEVLEEYGVDPDDPFKLAIEKLVFDSINELFEASISQQLFAPVIYGWAEKTLGFDIRDKDILEVASTLNDLLNQDLSSSGGAATYFATRVVGPLIGNPPYINYTMDQLINSITGKFEEEKIGNKLSWAINILTAGNLISRLEFLTDFDLDIPCGLPDNAIDLLEMILYDHIGLNPNGLALIELVKFYMYFNGSNDFENYMAKVDAAIEDMHGKLSGSLSKTILPIIRALDFAGDMQIGIDKFAREIPGRRVIAKAIAELVADQFETAGINTRQSIRKLLLDFDIYIDQADFPNINYRLSDVGELRAAIGTISMQPIEQGFDYAFADQVRVNEIIRASAEYSDLMVEFAQKFLFDYIGKGWGSFDLNLSMQTVIKEYIASRIDLGGSVGASVNSVYGGLLSARWSSDSIIEALPIFGTIHHAMRAADGDCIAGWRLYIEAAEYVSTAMAWLDSGATLTALISSDAALEVAYNTAVSFFVDTLAMEVASKIFGQFMGNYSMTTSVVIPEDYQFNIAEHSELTPVRVNGMIMGDKLGFVLREEFDFINPRKLSLVTLQPSNPAATKYELDLGEWTIVDYVHNIQGMVMVGGLIWENGAPVPASLFVDASAQFPEVTVLTDSKISSATDIALTGGGATMIISGPAGIYFAPVWSGSD